MVAGMDKPRRGRSSSRILFKGFGLAALTIFCALGIIGIWAACALVVVTVLRWMGVL